MSSIKILGAADLRAEVARKNVTRRELAAALGLSYSYVKKILMGIRNAETRRAEMARWLESRAA